MLTEHILEVNEANFENEVLLRSHELPVVVDFWAPWCGPCRVLGPLLERLTIEAGGAFRLAKVNVDDNPNLAVRYGVQGIPAVKAFRQGDVRAEFVGALPEPMVRRFLAGIAPSPSDRAVAEARSLLTTRHWAEAEAAFRDVLEQDETNAAAALGLLESCLMQGKGGEALEVLGRFPSGSEWAKAEKLRPLAQMLAEAEGEEPSLPDDPLAAEYGHAARLVRQGNIPAAMDGLLDILRQDKGYRQGQAKEALLGLFTLLGENDPLTREYREELASILFK